MVARMPANTVRLENEGERVVRALEEALGKLDSAGGEVVLDFSSVRRIDPGALWAMEELAGIARDKAVKVVLRGVSIDIYRVLKPMNLAPRFSYVT